MFFLVGADGTLSNFVIEKGLNDLADKEAIRLIKEGPEWKSSGPTEARVTVKFK